MKTAKSNELLKESQQIKLVATTGNLASNLLQLNCDQGLVLIGQEPSARYILFLTICVATL